MKNVFLLLLVLILAIGTALSSRGETITKSTTTKVIAKLGIASDATNAFSGESVKLPDRILTNDVFIYSVNSITGSYSTFTYYSSFGGSSSDTRQALSPMQVILIDRITRPRNPIANISRTNKFTYEANRNSSINGLSKRHSKQHLTRTKHK